MFKVSADRFRFKTKLNEYNYFIRCFKSNEKNLKQQQNDYSKTLNLPNSGKFELSMKKICEIEENIKKVAKFDTLYEWQLENRKTKPTYVLHDGPPYANGDIHIGHMVNKVLKDICNRYKLLSGYKINYVPGWDCHGLPIELNAIKSLKQQQQKSNKSEATTANNSNSNLLKNDPIEIRKNAIEYAKKCIQLQMNTFKQMNLLADWNTIYRTIDANYMCNEIDLFFNLYEKKLIYRDYMPVYWSVSSRTALAEFELEYNQNHKSDALYVSYELVDYPQHIKSLLKTSSQKVFAPIWTTTPWSLPCNKAIAFNPNLKYALLQLNNNNENVYLIANELVEQVREKIPIFKESTILSVIDGNALTNSFYSSLFNKETKLPLLASDHVGSKQGTGLVHIAPALGQDDFKLALKHNLTTECMIDELGKYNSDNDHILSKFGLNGRFVLNNTTIDRIREILKEFILYEHSYVHSYPYDWRTKKPCIIRSSMQWFIDTNRLKEESLNQLTNVRIRPSNVKSSMNATLKSRPYWCISRQRSWGLPIPCFYLTNNKTNEQTPIVNRKLIENFKNLIKKDGSVDFWWTNKYDKELIQSCLNHDENEINKKEDLESFKITKSNDIFDIWFDSGSSFNTLTPNNNETADLYCEGVDQFSGWFQSSLLLSVAFRNQSPYKNLLVHGFVVDESNRKMSKSIGNVIEPRQAIKGIPNKLPQCGLDVLRFWIAHEYYKPQIQIGPVILEKFVKRTFEIRSILRFIVGNLNDLSIDKLNESLVKYEDMFPIDKYILNQLNELLDSVVENYDDYNLHKVIQLIESFFLTQLSSFYIKSVKDRLYCEAKCSIHRRSAQSALYYVLIKCLVMIGPIMPHLAEEAFHYSLLNVKNSKNGESVISSDCSSLFRSELNFDRNSQWSNKDIADLFELVNQLRNDYFELIQSDNSVSYEISLECNKELYDYLNGITNQTNPNGSNSWLTECFGCSWLSLKLNDFKHQNSNTSNSEHSKHKKISIKNISSGEYKLTANKIKDKFMCGRCRRYTSDHTGGALCIRCQNVIKIH